MKQIMYLLVACIVCFSGIIRSQTYSPTHSTKLIFKNGNKLTINPPAFGSDFSWTLPSSNASGALTNDGSGTLSWLTATDAATASALVKRDASKGFAAGRIVIVDQNELRINDLDNSNFVGFGTPSNVTTSYTLTFPDAPPSTNGQILSSTTGGVLSWVTVGGLSGGTSNAITKWTSATAVGNSTMTDNGSTITFGSNASVDIASGNINTAGEYQRGGARILDNPGTNNLRVGGFAGHNNTGVSNTYVGSSAGAGVSSGSDNVYLGYNSGVQTAPASSSNNVMIGSNVGTFSNGSSNNTFVGYGAAVLHTSGDGNTFLGTNAGTTSTGESNNTLLGGSTDIAASISNATAIGNRAYAGVSNAVVLGSINGVNGSASDALVGIGTSAPTQKLEIKSGNLLLSNAGTPGQIQFQGTSSGVSTITAGAQGATTINYTLPTTQPMASQVLTATAVTGSGPYAVTLGWTMGGITYLKTADESVNSAGTGSTMQDDNHLSGIPIGDGEIWAFDGFLLYSSPSNTPDVKFQFVATQNVTISSYWIWGGAAFVTNTGESSVAAGTTSTTVIPNYNATPAVGSVHVKGTIVNTSGSAASLKLQWAQNTADANNATLLAGSYLTFSRVK
jgi:hypothetical protein